MDEDTPVEQPTAPLNVAGAVPHIVSDDNTDDLKIRLGEFEGPLDLLLHLIRQEQVSIYDIPVARITDEYLRYLRVMQELDIAVAGDFLVMAATLIELKTKMLLPRDPLAAPEEEDDPRTELVNQLLEYQKYKAAAEMLWSRATVERRSSNERSWRLTRTIPKSQLAYLICSRSSRTFWRDTRKRSCSRSSAKRFRWLRCWSVCAIWSCRRASSICEYFLKGRSHVASWCWRFCQCWS
jgi:hypothetical protein